jgi:mRNA interferase MazF
MALIDGWQTAGRLKPSMVKPVFATVEQRLIIRRLGALKAEDQGALQRVIAELLA